MLEEKQTVAAIYETLGISREVYAFGSEIEKTLPEPAMQMILEALGKKSVKGALTM